MHARKRDTVEPCAILVMDLTALSRSPKSNRQTPLEVRHIPRLIRLLGEGVHPAGKECPSTVW